MRIPPPPDLLPQEEEDIYWSPELKKFHLIPPPWRGRMEERGAR